MPEQSWTEKLFHGLGDAIADVREKAVEEGWFGRVVTERGEGLDWPQEAQQQQTEPQGVSGEILPPEHAASHEAGGWPQLEHGTIEGHAERVHDTPKLDWPQGRESAPEQDQDRSRDIGLDR